MKICKANMDDAETCAAIAVAAYRDYVLLIERRPAPMLADYAAHIARDTVFVVEIYEASAGIVVGFIVIFKKGDGYWLENIAMTPSASGQGLGKRIIDFIEDYLRPLCDRYQLYTNVKMKRNIGWYHALGFSETFCGEFDGYDRVYFEKEKKIDHNR